MNSSDAGYVLLPGEGREIDLGNFKMSVKREGAGAGFSLLEATEPPGFGPPLHIHRDADEAFYVLEGEYIITLDEREVSCPAGSFIFIPAGKQHGFRVGDLPSRKLNIYSPSAMIGYFDELSAMSRSGQVDPQALAEMADRYQMEVLDEPSANYT